MTDNEQKTIKSLIAFQRKLIIAFSIGLVICFSLAAFAVQYVGQVDRKRASDERANDREWCELIQLYTDYYKENPPNPNNPLAVKQADLMFRRFETLDC